MSETPDPGHLPPGEYAGVIVRDAETGEILAVEHLSEGEGPPLDPPAREGWLARNKVLLDTIRPITEVASLAGTPALRAAVAGAWLVVDAARLHAEPPENRARTGLRAASLGLAGIGLAATLRGAPRALASRGAILGGLRRALDTAERVIARREREGGSPSD